MNFKFYIPLLKSPLTYFWGYFRYILMFFYHIKMTADNLQSTSVQQVCVSWMFLAQIHIFALLLVFSLHAERLVGSLVCLSPRGKWGVFVARRTGKTWNFSCITCFDNHWIPRHMFRRPLRSSWWRDSSWCLPFLVDTSLRSAYLPAPYRPPCEESCCKCSVEAFWYIAPEFAQPSCDPSMYRNPLRKG